MIELQKISRFWSLSLGRKSTILEALVLLPLAFLMIRTIPFRWYHWLLKRRPRNSTVTTSRVPTPVPWAVSVVSQHLPWKSTCLMQAIATRWMLSLRGKPSKLFLGTRKNRSGELDFHAWLTCEDEVVCGHFEHEKYTVIHSFG